MSPLSEHSTGIAGIALASHAGIPAIMFAAGLLVLLVYCRKKPDQP